MGNYEDLTGQRFGRLRAIERVENDSKRQARWKCQCDCGNETIVRGVDLKRGNTKSCGCLVHESRTEDLTGRRFNKLVVIGRGESQSDKSGRKYAMWLCKCDCGNIKSIRTHSLVSGKTVSCGCYAKSIKKENSVKSNPKVRRLYQIWAGMKARCYNPNQAEYRNYGGRGITICPEWLNDFREFEKWSYENGYEENLTIDRKDVNGNYEPSNCRWITLSEQQNNKRNTVYLEVNGEKTTLKDLSEETGINRNTLYARYSNGAKENDLVKKPTLKAPKKVRKDSLRLTIDGKSLTVTEWSRITGIKRSTLHNRYYAGKRGLELIKKPRKKSVANNKKDD